MQKVLTTLEDRIDPAHTALIVVDMQNDFCAEGGYIHKTQGADMSANEPLAERIGELVIRARETGVPVVWIQACYEDRYLSGQALAKKRERGIEDICCEGGSWGWDFYRLQPEPGELIIEKHSYSAFFGTELDRLLRFRGIRTLTMTGVATQVCVESTLRDGYFNGYYIAVPEDCVGSSAPQQHEAALTNVRTHFGDVTDRETVAAIWRQNAVR